MAQILPSIFGADIMSLDDEIKFLEEENTQILHVDMMDGNFVSNIAFGPNQIAAMKKESDMVFDVHMMVQNPKDHLDDVIATGAEMISVHYESTPHIHNMMQRIRKAGRKAGVVINPATPESVLEYLLDDIDYILVMTINPGTSGASEKDMLCLFDLLKKTGDFHSIDLLSISGQFIQNIQCVIFHDEAPLIWVIKRWCGRHPSRSFDLGYMN